jgi:Fe2+ or Zn2+ uptake regulation protein
MRLTTHRKEILALLAKQEEALSAAEIHTHLPHINLVTIYRSLEQFVAADLVKKLFLGEQEALYEIQDEPHHHAICANCQKIIHFTFDDTDLKQRFLIPGFSVRDIEVTVHGQCTKHLHQKPRTKTK